MKTTFLKNTSSNLLYACFVIVILLSITSCKKRKDIQPELPPITQEGKNTFGCMFGDEFWLPANLITFAYPNLSIRYTQEKTLMLECRRKSLVSELQRDVMFIDYNEVILDEGEYELNQENSRITILIDDKAYFLHSEGKLTISRLDTENKIISGTFYFSVKEENTGEIVEVTNGRFDAIYKNY